jgi:hypothetical protein
MIKIVIAVISALVSALIALKWPLFEIVIIDFMVTFIPTTLLFLVVIWRMAQISLWFTFKAEQIGIAVYNGESPAAFHSGNTEVVISSNGVIGSGKPAEEIFGGIVFTGLFTKKGTFKIGVNKVENGKNIINQKEFNELRLRNDVEGIAPDLEINYGIDGTGSIHFNLSLKVVDAGKLLAYGVNFQKLVIAELVHILKNIAIESTYSEFMKIGSEGDLKIKDALNKLNQEFTQSTENGKLNSLKDLGLFAEFLSIISLSTSQFAEKAEQGIIEKSAAAKQLELELRQKQLEQEERNQEIENRRKLSEGETNAKIRELAISAELTAEVNYLSKKIKTLKSSGLSSEEIAKVLVTDSTYDKLPKELKTLIIGSQSSNLLNLD